MAAFRARCLSILACAAFGGCANPCVITTADASTGHLSLVSKEGVIAEVDLSSDVPMDFVVNGLQVQFSIDARIRVTGAMPAYASFMIRAIEGYQGIGTFRLEDLETETCVCFGPDCAAWSPKVECMQGMEGTIAILKAEKSCQGTDCTQDFVADVTILKTSGNLSGAIHLSNHMKYSTDNCGKPIH